MCDGHCVLRDPMEAHHHHDEEGPSDEAVVLMVLSITPLVTGADRLAELAGVDVIRGSVRPRVGVDLSVGANAMAPSGPLHGLRAAVEVGVPVYQRLDGPQLETDLVLTVGAQYAFHL